MTPWKVTTAPARGSRTRAATASSESGASRSATWTRGSPEPPLTGGSRASSSPAASRWAAGACSRLTARHERQVAGQVAHRGQRVGDAGAVGQVELEHVAPGALAQHGEEADADAHRAGGYPADVAPAVGRRRPGGRELGWLDVAG